MIRITLYLVGVSVITATVPEDICESCLPTTQCPLFLSMSKKQQKTWLEEFPCKTPKRTDFGAIPGFASTAIGDYVCCSNKIWGVEIGDQVTTPLGRATLSDLNGINSNNTYSDPKTFIEKKQDIKNDPLKRIDESNVTSDNLAKNSGSDSYVWYPDRSRNYDNTDYWANNRDEYGNNKIQGGFNSANNFDNRGLNNRNRYWNEIPGRNQWNYNQNDYRTARPLAAIPPYNNGPYSKGNLNNNFNYGNSYVTASPYFPNNNRGNSFENSGQCDRLTSFPPEPQSGCCGREAADDDRITDNSQAPTNFAPAYNENEYDVPANELNSLYPYKSLELVKGAEDSSSANADISSNTVLVENRISGGKATELYQFPWTVLLQTSFDYGDKQADFNCGGSLISSKYVLSAGHCVYDKEAIIKSVKVNLAEYDKRTFPNDCKTSSQGRKCINNIVMYAQNVLVHPQYDDETLFNDISLIRLQGVAPYTEFIRPLCLPPINIDEPQFSNLQFEVAGWGRNGLFKSEVKQSTFLHLVNKRDCKRYYPNLTPTHLCAAGNKGEDTCKGDSGGPLMMLYRGRYYATGVVSGKRADTPCGTTVPSLYTNVYLYLDWIRSNIRN